MARRSYAVTDLPGFSTVAILVFLALYAPMAVMVVFSINAGESPGQMEGLIVNQFELLFQYVDGVQEIESKSIQQVALRVADTLDATIDREMAARRRSLLYLEKLRLFHAVVTVLLIIALLGWAIVLWENGAASAGDVVLVCTLGLSILSATRDLAVALVDVTQHVARMTEAIATLLLPHDLKDHPEAEPLIRSGAAVAFNNVAGPEVKELLDDCFGQLFAFVPLGRLVWAQGLRIGKVPGENALALIENRFRAGGSHREPA